MSILIDRFNDFQDRMREAENISERGQIVSEWVKAGGYPNDQDEEGNTVLHLFLLDQECVRMHHEIAERIFDDLIAQGCDPRIPNAAGMTALDMGKACHNFSDGFIRLHIAVCEAKRLRECWGRVAPTRTRTISLGSLFEAAMTA